MLTTSIEKRLFLLQNEFLNVLDFQHDVTQFSEKLFLSKSSFAKKICVSKILNNKKSFNLAYLIWIFRNLNVNLDLIFKFINIFEQDGEIVPVYIELNSLKSILNVFGEQRTCQLFFQTDNFEIFSKIDDLVQTFNEKKFDFGLYLKKEKSQTLEEIYKTLFSLKQKIKNDDYNLNQDLDKFKNIEVDDFVFDYPKTHYELIELGRLLNVCLDNGYYSRGVKRGCYNIIYLKQNGKPKYVFQFSKFDIHEAKAFNNESVPKNIFKKVISVLTTKPIIDVSYHFVESSFILGYKYKNNNLSLAIKEKYRGDIKYYDYNIDQEMFKSFVDSKSKGSFFAKNIKKTRC